MFLRSYSLTAVLIAITLFVSGVADAAPIIDFEGMTAPGTRTGYNVTPYAEDGFTLTSSGGAEYHNDIFNNIVGSNGNRNTTSIFGWCGICDGPYGFTLTGPGPFSLVSIDFGGLTTGQNPSPIDVIGQFAGGGSITQVVDPAAIFATFLFPGFVNLSSLTFGAQGPSVNFAADNIVLQAAAVPEPSSLLLFGTGAAAMSMAVRRRRKQQIQ